MTPVATAVAIRASSLDAALAQTLAAEPAFGDAAARATVHSVHRRVLNVLCGAELIAIADDGLDDAPATIRVPMSDWEARSPIVGAPVDLAADRLVIPTRTGDLVVRLDDAPIWAPVPADLSLVPPARLRALSTRIAAGTATSSPVTAFGRAAAGLLDDRADALRAALRAGAPADVSAAAHGLLGLGEGLTPSGDDILTGLGFFAAQPGMRLGAHRWALADAAADEFATTLLGAVTVRHALHGRARQRLHDLAASVRDGDEGAFDDAVSRIRAIGHTSGEDILTGIRLALDTESDLRDGARTPTHPHRQGEHR
jgi:hypothetical protein